MHNTRRLQNLGKNHGRTKYSINPDVSNPERLLYRKTKYKQNGQTITSFSNS
jgi:hypothetical protein